MKQLVLAALAALSISLPGTALAQESDPRPEAGGRDTVSIGLGVGTTADYEGSDDYRLIPGGALRGQVGGINFFTRGLSLHVDLVPDGNQGGMNVELGPVVGVRLNRTGDVEDNRVNALGELDTAWELGGFVGIGKTGVITSDYDTLSLRLAYKQDVGDAHGSYILTPSLEYGTPLSQTSYVGVSVSADIVGDDYASYYFDISTAGALASGLPAYSAEGGLKDIGVGFVTAFSLSGDLRRGWSLFGIANHKWLQGDFADSPIVSLAGSDSQWLLAVGVGYTF